MAKVPAISGESERDYERRLLRQGWYINRPPEQAERARIRAGIYDQPKFPLLRWIFG